jgi:hypothetical protein
MKTRTYLNRSKAGVAPPNRRTSTAPSSASVQLLMNQHSTIGSGTPEVSCTAKWARRAAARMLTHRRGALKRRPARSRALGGQSVETGVGWSVRAKPSLAPA